MFALPLFSVNLDMDLRARQRTTTSPLRPVPPSAPRNGLRLGPMLPVHLAGPKRVWLLALEKQSELRPCTLARVLLVQTLTVCCRLHKGPAVTHFSASCLCLNTVPSRLEQFLRTWSYASWALHSIPEQGKRLASLRLYDKFRSCSY